MNLRTIKLKLGTMELILIVNKSFNNIVKYLVW
jgi:hypothetical protein